MASAAYGLSLVANNTNTTTTATSTNPITTGIIGGSVHLALSNSSVIGMWPKLGAGCCGLAGAAFGGWLGWFGLLLSGMDAPVTEYSFLRCWILSSADSFRHFCGEYSCRK